MQHCSWTHTRGSVCVSLAEIELAAGSEPVTGGGRAARNDIEISAQSGLDSITASESCGGGKERRDAQARVDGSV